MKLRLALAAFCLLLGMLARPASAQVQITEFMASNSRTLADDYGEYEDWIEIHNSSQATVNLYGWHLTDSAGNLTKWQFPSANLPSKGYLVVFASNRDRRAAGAVLHTNFKLDAAGEYLALVRPDGSIATQFSPDYPPQMPDVSFGPSAQVFAQTAITTGSVGRVRIPLDASLGQAWTSNNFNHASWAVATNGIGFGTGGGGSAASFPEDLLADTPLGYWRLNESVTTAPAVNLGSLGTAADGQFLGGVASALPGVQPPTFPGFDPTNRAARFNGNDSRVDVPYSASLNPSGPFTVEFWAKPAATPTTYICPLSAITWGTSSRRGWLFYENASGQWEFRLGRNSATYIATAIGGTVQVGVWQHIVGVYDGVNAQLFVNGTSVASVGISAAFVPNASSPLRLGATGNGIGSFFYNGDLDEVAFHNRALTTEEVAQRFAAATTAVVHYSNLIKTDVGGAMQNVNASAYLRLPFTFANTTLPDQITLRMKYDDGFAAWLNGIPAASANSPLDPEWNSTATAVNSPGNATQFAEFDLTSFRDALVTGSNTLAIQGLNIDAADDDFLALAELELSGVAYQVESRYFVEPSPASLNGVGTRDLGPILTFAGHSPNTPAATQSLTVTCKVTQAFAPITNITLNWRVMFGVTNRTTLVDDGQHGDGAAGDGVYGAVIPASNYAAGQMVRWYFTAADSEGRISRWPLFESSTDTAEYLGTVIQPDYVTSKLPVLHLFAPASVLQPGTGPGGGTSLIGADSQAGGRVSAFYGGEFYDNIYMSLRGNSTAGYYKKSHRLEFNKEHPFRHPGPGGRLRKTSFTADYPDPAYMRQGLSFWLCDVTGAPAPFYEPWRLQLNGAFYQLANHNDVHGEELLSRLGYDPNGALYNAAGTIQPGGFSTGGFEKKTRKWEGNTDYLTLANSIAESLTTGQRLTNMLDRLDLPEVINYLVVARFVHENDDVWANMSVYHDNDGDDLWRIVPFDMNLSLGAAFMDSWEYNGIQVTNDNLKSFPLYGSSQAIPSSGGGSWNRMYDAIFQVPQTREMFLRRMRTFLDTWVKPPGTPANALPLEAKVLAWRDLIAEEALRDRNWWGWPGNGGQCNFDPGITPANGVNSLINDFIVKRRQHFYGKHSVTNTTLAIGISKTQNTGIPLAQPTNAVISILGWDYNPASGNQDEEYVCLTNANGFAVDVSGWKLEGGLRHKLQPGTVIPARTALFVSPNSLAFRHRTLPPHGGMGLFVQGGANGHLNAWGENLMLTDELGRLVATNGFAGAPSAVQRYLRITEIMYNPSPAPAIANDAQQFEYIELKNTSTSVPLALGNVRFSSGIVFNFTGSAVTQLLPGQRVLLVRNQAAFAARYGAGFLIAGEFAGALDSDGETLRLDDAVGEKVLEFSYNNTWYRLTDGLGFSLVIRDENAPWYAWDEAASWQASGTLDGSPGAPNILLTMAPIVINEVLAHTDLPDVDALELCNPGTTNVNIGGWFLTDDFYAPKKYRIMSGTQLPAGGYLVFNANQFGVGGSGFQLSEYGESAYLFSGDADTNLTGYVHGFEFGETPNGVSLGRHLNSQGSEMFVLQSAKTLGTNNAAPRVGPIVVSEIMYHPPDFTNGVDNELNEFIELENIAATNVPLYCVFTSEPGYGNAARTNTWRLRNAVDFDFPTNQALAAGARLLIVGFDPTTNTVQLAAFRALYAIAPTVPVYGPWSGKLDNSADAIELKWPDKPDLTTNVFIPYITAERIHYGDNLAWPSQADGSGNSLQRLALASFGDEPTNWIAGAPSAGRANVANLLPSVSLTSPSNGAVFSRNNGVPLLASANDSDGSVATVEFYDGNNQIGSSSAPPFSFTWMNPPAGVHFLKARAVDDGGGVALSDAVSITVTTQPPVVTITSPAAGAIFRTGASVPISATASDSDGTVAALDFYENGLLLTTITTSPFSFSWTPQTSGDRTLSAVARDDGGDSSQPVSVTVYVQGVVVNPVLVPASDTWRYLDNGVAQDATWNTSAFNDSSWSSGSGKLGFKDPGNAGYATVLSFGGNSSSKYPAYYFRKPLNVTSLTGMTNVLLEVLRDDSVIVYINGVEVYRNNLPGGPIAYDQLGSNCADNGTEWQTTNFPMSALRIGTNLIAAEVHQSSLSSSDLTFDLRLTLLGSVVSPAITAQPQSQIVTEGANVGFSVSALGDAPFTYQWRKNGVPFGGQAGDTLNFSAVTSSDAGKYDVLVSNSGGSATSRSATLTVNPGDPIRLDGTSQADTLILRWSGGLGPYQVQRTTNLTDGIWENEGPATTNQSLSLMRTNARSFYRVLGR